MPLIKPLILKYHNKADVRLNLTLQSYRDAVNLLIQGLFLDSSVSFGKNSGDYLDDTLSVFIGQNAGKETAGGKTNIAIGKDALRFNVSGHNNIAIGNAALYYNDSADFNIGIGYHTLYSNVEAEFNIAIGYEALYSAGGSPYLGWYNTAIGYRAGKGLTIGSYNVLIGANAGLNMTSTSSSIGIGVNSLYSCTTGNAIALGHEALYSLTTGGSNIALGHQALYTTDEGSGNIAIGNEALGFNESSHYNIAIGYRALYNHNIDPTADGANIAIGDQSGAALTTGTNNVIIGYMAGQTITTDSGCVFIGYKAGQSEASANKLYIANTNTATPLIKGTFPNVDITLKATTANITSTTINLDGTVNLGGGTTYYLGDGAAASKLYTLTVEDVWASVGAVGTPSYSFQGDTNTGMYHSAADQIGFAVGGVQRARVQADYFNVKPSSDSYGLIIRDSGTDSFYVNLKNVNGTVYLIDTHNTAYFLAGDGQYAYANDHGTAATDQLINVCYGTGAAPAASSTTIGALYIKYTA